MRLLQRLQDGAFELTSFDDEHPPLYVILSHTWTKGEEVTYDELVAGGGRNKTGYDKLRFCAEQAATDGYQYFWIDTCCIDKTNSAELSEAINSMWRYYRKSQICYAYLNDVNSGLDDSAQNIALAESKWFERGWTLQELLAPKELVLYGKEWHCIGTRDEFAEKISKITKIDIPYLIDASKIAGASVAEKMSWASMRRTEKTEDAAYSLLGIFDISMPLLYGEGAKAFRRLQEEIVKQSADQSIFTWSQLSEKEGDGTIFAPSPKHFEKCQNIVRNIDTGAGGTYNMTNKGLHAELRILGRGDEVVAVLNCRYQNDLFSDIGIWLCKDRDGRYRRSSRPLQKISIAYSRARLQWIYMETALGGLSLGGAPRNGSCFIRNLPEGYMVTDIHPPCPALHVTSLNTSCIQVQTPPEDTSAASQTVVVVKPQVPGNSDAVPGFVFTIFRRRTKSKWVTDACMLPILVDEDIDAAKQSSEWNLPDLAKLARFKRLAKSTIFLHITEPTIQTKQIVVIDVATSSHRLQIAEVKVVEIMTLISRSLFSLELYEQAVTCRKYLSYLLPVLAILILRGNINDRARMLRSVAMVLGLPVWYWRFSEEVKKYHCPERLQELVNTRHGYYFHVLREFASACHLLGLGVVYVDAMCLIFDIPSPFSVLVKIATPFCVFSVLQYCRWGIWL